MIRSVHLRLLKNFPIFPLAPAVLLAALLASCSFDYSSMSGSETDKADIIMEEIEYVRVRGGDPLVRFRAEYAERWEERQIMNLTNFSFEQMEDKGDNVDADGRAGSAIVQLDSGNITLAGGIRINVESEDVTIETASLNWQDKEKVLSGSDEGLVIINRSDGTNFSGRGFFADARNRTWAFSGEVRGLYVEEDEDEEDGDKKDKEFEPTRIEWSRDWEQSSVEQMPRTQEPLERASVEQIPEQVRTTEQPAPLPVTPDEEK